MTVLWIYFPLLLSPWSNLFKDFFPLLSPLPSSSLFNKPFLLSNYIIPVEKYECFTSPRSLRLKKQPAKFVRVEIDFHLTLYATLCLFASISKYETCWKRLQIKNRNPINCSYLRYAIHFPSNFFPLYPYIIDSFISGTLDINRTELKPFLPLSDQG